MQGLQVCSSLYSNHVIPSALVSNTLAIQVENVPFNFANVCVGKIQLFHPISFTVIATSGCALFSSTCIVFVDRTLIAGQKSPSSKGVRAEVTLERAVGDKPLKIKIPNCLVDDGYMLCTGVYSSRLSVSVSVVVQLEYTDLATKRKKVEHCMLDKVFHDPEENIIGADALAHMTLCVEPGKGVRQALAHK